MLERISNETAPPMNLKAIKDKQPEFYDVKDDTALRAEMKGMEAAFEGRGNLENWSADVLEMIDDCFKKHYMVGENPSPSLFFPKSDENVDKFQEYCDDVDQVLRMNPKDAPRYAREYFAYYSIWQMRDFRFPVPLGTATAVEVLHNMVSRVRTGFTEVSHHSNVIWDRLFCVIFFRVCRCTVNAELARCLLWSAFADVP
jgi:hypothetical protein